MAEEKTIVERIDRQIKALMAQNVELTYAVETGNKAHNDLLLVFVALMHQLGGEVLVKREHYPALSIFDYNIEWEDCPEEGGMRVKCYYRSTDEQK
jgi:hypothetical protein